MGHGGDLIWTGVFRELRKHDGQPVIVANAPKLTDVMAGRLYDRAATFRDRSIFAGNPDIKFVDSSAKGILARSVDTAFVAFLKLFSLRRRYEQWITRLARKNSKQGRIVHLDMLSHSYAESETNKKFTWKKGGHAIAIILKGFGVDTSDPCPRLFLDATERRSAERIASDSGIIGPYIAFEPETNEEWFGQLRSWPRERWVELIARLRRAIPDVLLVQIGVGSSPPIPHAVDLRGKTTFREAAALIQRSRLFIGTEGGLMHAARAVDARALILWGGVTLPEFAGYPAHHTIICHRVACAPCGHLGWCANSHVCMRSITVEEVGAATLDLLEDDFRADRALP